MLERIVVDLRTNNLDILERQHEILNYFYELDNDKKTEIDAFNFIEQLLALISQKIQAEQLVLHTSLGILINLSYDLVYNQWLITKNCIPLFLDLISQLDHTSVRLAFTLLSNLSSNLLPVRIRHLSEACNSLIMDNQQIDIKTLFIPINNRLYLPRIFSQDSCSNSVLADFSVLVDKIHQHPIEAEQFINILQDAIHLKNTPPRDALERTEWKILIRQLNERLLPLYEFIIDNSILVYEMRALPKNILLQINSDVTWLKIASERYFTQKLLSENAKPENIQFHEKKVGVQMGAIMELHYQDHLQQAQRQLIYIKTHQYGSARNGGSTIKPVDPKELYIYKLLEFTGYGPKAYFYYNSISPTGFFIATQDEGFTKVPNKYKLFQTYSMMQDNPPNVTDQVKHGLARAELLVRLYHLWDVVTNYGNFGLVQLSDHREKWRIIDFRVENKYTYKTSSKAKTLSGFVNGKALDVLTDLPKAALYDISAEERQVIALNVYQEFLAGKLATKDSSQHKLPLKAASEKAFEVVKAYFTHEQYHLQLPLEEVFDDLERYHHDCQYNVEQFCLEAKQIFERQAEKPESVTAPVMS